MNGVSMALRRWIMNRALLQVVAKHRAEQAVIGGQKPGRRRDNQQRLSVGAYAWVNHCNVDGAFGKEAIVCAQDEGALPDILRLYLVSQVYDRGRGVDPQDHTVQNTGIGTSRAEIGGQDYGGSNHGAIEIALKGDG